MKHKQYKAYNQNDVNKSGRYVERKEPEQPEKDQNCGDNPKHVVISLPSSARRLRKCKNNRREERSLFYCGQFDSWLSVEVICEPLK
jgi:hypothetical protein